MMDGMGMGMGMMMAMGVIFLLVLGLAVVGIVLLVQRNPRGSSVSAAESPEELLRRRYAAGELDEDDYERRRAGLHD